MRDWEAPEFKKAAAAWVAAMHKAWEIGCECHRCQNNQRMEAGDIVREEYLDLAEVHFFADYDAGMIYQAMNGKPAVVHYFYLEKGVRNPSPPHIKRRSESHL